jgi:hypothetical protein
MSKKQAEWKRYGFSTKQEVRCGADGQKCSGHAGFEGQG